MSKRLIGLLMAGVFTTVACGSSGTSTEVTYYQDVKPIIDAKCNSCHLAGGIAPFVLETYQDAVQVAGEIKLNVEDGIMPPWPPSSDCDEYWGERSLTTAQIETISAWVDQGTPEGDATNPGDPLVPIDDLRLSRVDETLAMPVEYTATLEPDDYRCFLVPWPSTYTSDVFVTGYNIKPGNAETVHHVIVFLADASKKVEYDTLDAADPGPGYTCFGASGGTARSWLGAWAPGGQGYDYPTGSGIRVSPGSFLIMQVHYNLAEGGPVAPDLSSIEISIEPTVDTEAAVMPFTNYLGWVGTDAMMIPAGEPDVVHTYSLDPLPIMAAITDGSIPSNTPITIYSSSLHMHNLGTRAVTSIVRGAGGNECLVDIPRWDFAWQEGYAHKQPKVLMPGDQLKIECHWNNSAANQPVIGGQQQAPRDVVWGEGTGDEMCLGVFFITAAP